jgi:hypothetical protein
MIGLLVVTALILIILNIIPDIRLLIFPAMCLLLQICMRQKRVMGGMLKGDKDEKKKGKSIYGPVAYYRWNNVLGNKILIMADLHDTLIRDKDKKFIEYAEKVLLDYECKKGDYTELIKTSPEDQSIMDFLLDVIKDKPVDILTEHEPFKERVYRHMYEMFNHYTEAIDKSCYLSAVRTLMSAMDPFGEVKVNNKPKNLTHIPVDVREIGTLVFATRFPKKIQFSNYNKISVYSSIIKYILEGDDENISKLYKDFLIIDKTKVIKHIAVLIRKTYYKSIFAGDPQFISLLAESSYNKKYKNHVEPLFGLLMDIYCLCKMFRVDGNNNDVIFYGGLHHAEVYARFINEYFNKVDDYQSVVKGKTSILLPNYVKDDWEKYLKIPLNDPLKIENIDLQGKNISGGDGSLLKKIPEKDLYNVVKFLNCSLRNVNAANILGEKWIYLSFKKCDLSNANFSNNGIKRSPGFFAENCFSIGTLDLSGTEIEKFRMDDCVIRGIIIVNAKKIIFNNCIMINVRVQSNIEPVYDNCVRKLKKIENILH